MDSRLQNKSELLVSKSPIWHRPKALVCQDGRIIYTALVTSPLVRLGC